jgi:phosphoglycerol transferase MdoB-like AlkP superfamily enzyme
LKFLGLLLRFWSCAFSILIGLFLTALALLIVVTNIQNLDMSMLPWWKGGILTAWLAILGLAGILAGGLALLNRLKPLQVIYTLAAFVLIVYGFFINMAFRFSGRPGAISAAWLALGALLAFLGSLTLFGKPRRS